MKSTLKESNIFLNDIHVKKIILSLRSEEVLLIFFGGGWFISKTYNRMEINS